MAEYAHNILRTARDAQNIPRWRVAQEVGASDDTVGRWERGEVVPSPDDIDRYAQAIGDNALWHRWMLAKWESYSKRYIDTEQYSLPLSIIGLRHVIDDILQIHGAVERDAMDGTIDCPQNKAQFTQDLKRLMAAATDILHQVK